MNERRMFECESNMANRCRVVKERESCRGHMCAGGIDRPGRGGREGNVRTKRDSNEERGSRKVDVDAFKGDAVRVE